MVHIMIGDPCTREGCANARDTWGKTLCAEHVAEYKREWVRRPEVRARQAIRQRARYAADPAHQIALTRRWEERNPARSALIRGASFYVKWAVLTGLLIKPMACERCQREGYIEAAHIDHLAPFDVEWLCRSCHRQWDRNEAKTA